MLRVLVLGGTTEGSALARALADDATIHATLSLAGATRRPMQPDVPLRIGGFGGADGLAAWLRAERTGAVIDATHPFAQAITRNARLACDATGVPLLRIARPEWQPAPGDRWRMVADLEQAAAGIGPAPRRVLLTTGTRDLAPFHAQPQHDYLVRGVDPPPPHLLPPRCRVVAARGPFTLADELALLSEHRTQILVTKNSGGAATSAKLDAARRLGLPVLMVARPPAAAGPGVADWRSALAWLRDRHPDASTPRRV